MKNMNNVETALRVLVAAGTAATLTTCNPAPRPTVFFEGGTVTPEPTKPPRPTEIPTAVMTSTPDYGTVMTSTLPETQTTGIYIEMAQFVATGNQGNDEIMSTIPVTALVKMNLVVCNRKKAWNTTRLELMVVWPKKAICPITSLGMRKVINLWR